jgi:hypothetical protein
MENCRIAVFIGTILLSFGSTRHRQNVTWTGAMDRRGIGLISDALPFGRLRYGDANTVANAIRLRKASRLLT